MKTENQKNTPFKVDLKAFIEMMGIHANNTIRHFQNEQTEVSKNAMQTAYGYLELADYITNGILERQKYQLYLDGLEFLTTKQFEILFTMKTTAQKHYRERVHDPLPYIQTGEGSAIIYDRLKVRNWFENYYRNE